MDWSGSDVSNWLDWVSHKFDVSPVSAAVFPSSGRRLCSLSKEDFSRLAGPTTGATLHTHLSILRGHQVEPHPVDTRRQKAPSGGSSSTVVSLPSPAPSTSSVAQTSEASGHTTDAISCKYIFICFKVTKRFGALFATSSLTNFETVLFDPNAYL